MKILEFDEGLNHREIVEYRSEYLTIFLNVKSYVEQHCNEVQLIHIGSTAIPGLNGKPMVDCIAATNKPNLCSVQKQLIELGFHRRNVWTDTDSKPYVCGSIKAKRDLININIHLCNFNDENYNSIIQFRDLMITHPEFHHQYIQAKLDAHELSPDDPQKYNRAKEQIILNLLKRKPK